MTAKEKAKELFDKYAYYVRMYNDDTPRKDMQKKSALIAVDEIIAIKLLWYQKDTKELDYWNEVKQEIEKL